jgi:small subunit ribosomal protein S17|uniref:Small ribosomal subunit protein uS17c n=1 Tax=Thorea hispida TaxID=202687 RepID=A0A1C9CAR6_9FLOR|nr:ribosomal protein S17 [Thorea hispida]AOM65476.1 ribosomal protein S17 [Thorea hispida]ARX95845.1 30S ribosomal protein S17 [Thorea hispida]UNJ79130.1 ribosomal protein S17 [Thorea hispida]
MPTKERIGIVVSNKMIKTITVAIKNRISHRKYGKSLIRTRKYKVHDEQNVCQIGDIVKIHETRPLSKTKFWTLTCKIGTINN